MTRCHPSNASRDEKAIDVLKEKLSSDFEVKDLGRVSYCSGVEFKQSDGEVSMSQQRYVQELLQSFNMSDSKPVATSVNPGTKLKKNENPSDEELKLPYRELVGTLTYISVTTRPDIAFSIRGLGQFNNCYGTDHWKAAKRVLRYLKGTVDLGLVYEKKPGPIQGFVDAD